MMLNFYKILSINAITGKSGSIIHIPNRIVTLKYNTSATLKFCTSATHLSINGANIGMNAPFKPDYSHQPAHGTAPYAGLVLNDVVLNLGGDHLGKNHFFNMNNGIRANRSNLKVYNSTFNNIQLIPFYHNGSNQNGSAISIVGDNESEQAAPSALALMPNPDGSANVTNSRCGVYAAVTYTEINGCLFDTVDYGIDEQYLDIGLQSYLTANTINAYNYGIRLMENDGCDNINVEYNDITLLNKEKSAIGIYAGESNSHHTTAYIINGNNVRLLNATAGIQTAGVSNAQITFNTIELQKPLTYTAPTTTGIDLGGGGGNFLSCNHVSGHTVDSVPRYGYRIAQSQGNTIQCNVADSTSYSFRFEGVACKNTLLKGNYMGNAYCGLYLNQDAIIGQQPDSSIPPYHGNIWLDTARYTSGFGAVNLNAASPQVLFNSLFTTNIYVNAHNPKIPGLTSPPPFLVNDDQWFLRQNTGNSFDCQHSYVCMAALQDSGDLPPDDQLRMRVVNDSSVSSLFVPESKQIASQLVYAELKTDSSAWDVTAYAEFLSDKESLSEGILYKSDSVASVLKTDQINKNLELDQLLVQLESLSDSLMAIDSSFLQNSDSLLLLYKPSILIQLESIKEQIYTWYSESSHLQSNANAVKGQLNQALVSQQIPDANQKEVDRISLIYKQNGTNAILSNYESLVPIALQCPSSGGPSVFVARNMIRLVNDSIVYDDASTCSQMGILRLAAQQNSTNHANSFAVVPNPASTEITILLDQKEVHRYLLQIYNSMGEIVFEKGDVNMINNLLVSVSSIPNGLYTIRLMESNGNSMSSKLVIIR